MAGSVNKCIIVGNLARDPEIRTLNSGDRVANITVATSESWKDKQTGQQQERTEWHRVVFFNRLAEIAGEYLKKGSKVYVEGSLRTRKWQDQSGNDRYSTEVVLQGFNSVLTMLDGAPGNGGGQSAQRQKPSGGGGFGGGGFGDDLDDDVPFASDSFIAGLRAS